jgi:hypothetical protein
MPILIHVGDGPPPSPDATPSPSPAAVAALALRERIYSLRGKIRSDVNELEGFIDTALSSYFVPPQTTASFQTLVLARLALRDKVDILDEVVKALGIVARVSDTLPKLRQANQIRNDQAHSNVSFNPTLGGDLFPAIEQLMQWHSTRRSRGGIASTRIEVAELEQQAEFVAQLQVEVFRIWMAVLAKGSGRDPLAALDEMIASTPALANPAPKAKDPREK